MDYYFANSWLLWLSVSDLTCCLQKVAAIAPTLELLPFSTLKCFGSRAHKYELCLIWLTIVCSSNAFYLCGYPNTMHSCFGAHHPASRTGVLQRHGLVRKCYRSTAWEPCGDVLRQHCCCSVARAAWRPAVTRPAAAWRPGWVVLRREEPGRRAAGLNRWSAFLSNIYAVLGLARQKQGLHPTVFGSLAFLLLNNSSIHDSGFTGGRARSIQGLGIGTRFLCETSSICHSKTPIGRGTNQITDFRTRFSLGMGELDLDKGESNRGGNNSDSASIIEGTQDSRRW